MNLQFIFNSVFALVDLQRKHREWAKAIGARSIAPRYKVETVGDKGIQFFRSDQCEQ